MAAGDTITQSLDDSLPVVVASARQVREFEGVMPNLCDKVTLDYSRILYAFYRLI